jgi:hypothetical protein
MTGVTQKPGHADTGIQPTTSPGVASTTGLLEHLRRGG